MTNLLLDKVAEIQLNGKQLSSSKRDYTIKHEASCDCGYCDDCPGSECQDCGPIPHYI